MNKIYKVKFYRVNLAVEPIMRQETDVIFRTNLQEDDNRFEEKMWKEMWKQNPAWLLSHGPSTINFAGWSSVMYEGPIEEVKLVNKEVPEDLTGEGNMSTALTFHPLLPSDMRIVLRKAYERGLRDGNG